MTTQPPPDGFTPPNPYGPNAAPPAPLAQPTWAPPPVPAAAAPVSAPGLVRVHIQGSVMTSNMIVPTLMLDGRTVASKYGENAYELPAGRHRVELYAQWLRRYGQAALDVDVRPGLAVDVHYAAPFHQFTTGSIGLTPQTRKGVAAMVALIVVPLAIFLPAFWLIFFG